MHGTPEEKLLIGAHTSTAGGIHNALLEGLAIGATTVQIFTSNQKQWKGRVLSEEQIELWKVTLKETGLKKIMSHGSYLMNLGSANQELLRKSQEAFGEEIERCHSLDIDFLNFHPGAATSGTVEQCLDQIVHSLKKFTHLYEKGKTRLLLETTAGQGNSVGHEFEQLSYIIGKVEDKIPLGVCIDTCHIFSAGYDIRTQSAWEEVLEEFDTIIGLKYLHAFHVNDSMKPLGARRDRHAHLGNGEIGLEAFRFIMTHPKLREIPKYLETPKDLGKWTEEIALLRKMSECTV